MDGVVVGTERGKLIIYRANVCPLVEQQVPKSLKENPEKDDEE